MDCECGGRIEEHGRADIYEQLTDGSMGKYLRTANVGHCVDCGKRHEWNASVNEFHNHFMYVASTKDYLKASKKVNQEVIK